MRILHLGDIHLGKRVNEFSLLEDQKYILEQIVNITRQNNINVIVIAGDVYDRSIPSNEAVLLFDDFITQLAQEHYTIFILSGNHDGAERLSFGNRIMDISGVFFAPVFNGTVTKVKLSDSEGDVYFHMIPYMKPALVGSFYPEERTDSYNEAFGVVMKHADIDYSQRNVVIAHQFVTGSVLSDSEELMIGGLDNIDVSCFDGIDYTALGHIHRAQSAGSDTVRYSGSPLKYSFSKNEGEKSVTIVDIGKKGAVNIELIPLKPLRDMRTIRGKYDEITALDFYHEKNTQDFYQIILTDEEDIVEAIGKLRAIYPNIMKLEYDNKRTKEIGKVDAGVVTAEKSPEELFLALYEMQNNDRMNEEQTKLVHTCVEEIWGRK